MACAGLTGLAPAGAWGDDPAVRLVLWGRTGLVAVYGDLDGRTAGDLAGAVGSLVARAADLVLLDLEGVSSIDAAALATLNRLAEELRGDDRELLVACVPVLMARSEALAGLPRDFTLVHEVARPGARRR